MRATIKDIAEYTGLSITTVSLVLNNKPSRISQRAREAVFSAAEKLNYMPNQLAVGLAKKRTFMLGLIIGDLGNNFFSSLAISVENTCNALGWHMILSSTSNRHNRDLDAINLLAGRSVDGILYNMGADSTPKSATESSALFARHNLPFVLVDRSFPLSGTCTVRGDHALGGYLATRHLLEHGHKRIAIVTGPLQLSCAESRLAGYRRALEEYGIEYEPDYMIHGDYTMQAGIDAAERVRQLGATAVFACNDLMAFGLFKRFRALGVSIPGDISLVGYDDTEYCELLDPPLTTIRQPVAEVGKAGVQQLIHIIEGEPFAPEVVFAPVLVERASVSHR